MIISGLKCWQIFYFILLYLIIILSSLQQPTVMHLACVLLRMSMTESLIGATINSAYSLGLSKTHGSIEKGKNADLVIVNAPKYVTFL